MGTPTSFSVNATMKDKDGNVIVDGDGKSQTQGGDVTYDFGDTLKEAVEKYGEEVVFGNYKAQGKVRVQSVARTAVAGGATIEEAQAKVDEYVLGTAPVRTKKDLFGGYKDQFKSADKADQERMLKELAASISAGK